MELFALDQQHEPLKMLGDLIKLYALHYGVDGYDAIRMIRRDAQGYRNAGIQNAVIRVSSAPKRGGE